MSSIEMLPGDEARFRVNKLIVAYDEFLTEVSKLAYDDCDRLGIDGTVRAGFGAIWARGVPTELLSAREALKR